MATALYPMGLFFKSEVLGKEYEEKPFSKGFSSDSTHKYSRMGAVLIPMLLVPHALPFRCAHKPSSPRRIREARSCRQHKGPERYLWRA